MAWQGKNKDGNANSSLFPFQFVNCTLSSDEIQAMDELLAMKPYKLEQLIDDMCQENYKVAIAIDFKNEAFVCRVTGAEGNVNFNLCMSSYGGSVFDSVRVAWYKVFEIFKNGRWDVATKEKKPLRG